MPAAATARVRQLSRGGRRKNDRIEAAAAACVALLHADARPVRAEGHTDALGLLDERRTALTQDRVKAMNQLHAIFREMLPGGAPAGPTLKQARTLLCQIRPAGPVEGIRKSLAKDLAAQIAQLEESLALNAEHLGLLIRECGTTRTAVDGVGDILAARILARTGYPEQFNTAAAFANCAGAAPVRPPAPTTGSTGCPDTGTGSSIPRSTPLQSCRSGCPAAPDTPTTGGK